MQVGAGAVREPHQRLSWIRRPHPGLHPSLDKPRMGGEGDKRLGVGGLVADLDGPDAGRPGVPGGGGASDKVGSYRARHTIVEPEKKYAEGGRQIVPVYQFSKVRIVGYQGASFMSSQFQQTGVCGAPVGFPGPANIVAASAQGSNSLRQNIFVGQDSHTDRPRARSVSSSQALRSSQVKLDSLAPVAL